MDYSIKAGDEIIMVEIDGRKTEQREHLLEYYKRFLSEDGKEISEKKNEVLKHIAFSMSEEEAKNQCNRIDEARSKRLLAYQKALTEMLHPPVDELQEIKDTVDDLVEAYEDYDFEAETTVEINGNFFSFDPEKFDVNVHKDSLSKLGEESKGNTWRVEIDENGEVVLHW